MRVSSSVVMLALMLSPVSGRAEKVFGVELYPGAKSDAVTDKACGSLAGAAAGKTVRCFRTSDDFAKVYAFYANDPVLELSPMLKGMSPDARETFLVRGPKKSFDWCVKAKQEKCGFGIPSVRIKTPWSTNANISPATPMNQYEGKDVLVVINSLP